MESHGIRELRDNLASVMRRVRGGEVIEVTDHGHPIARIVPLRHRSRLEQLVAEGRVTPPDCDLLDIEPAPLQAGERPLSEILAELRSDER